MQNHKAWADSVWEKIVKKLDVVAPRSKDKIPYTTVDGVHDDRKDLDWWTNGFWAGVMWLLYAETKTEVYKEAAENIEKKMDAVFEDFVGLHHDVGFMWLGTSVANFQVTGNEKSFKRGMHAANVLAARFNTEGNFLRAWNDWGDKDQRGWAIIDSMMNIPILYWASEQNAKDPRFKQIAMKHADRLAETFIRPDGSVKHIVEFDPDSGEYVTCYLGQGYAPESSWSRGQSWALYGFAMSYMHTKEQRYLDTAKQVAHYFMACLQEEDDYVPSCDFRAPKEPVYKDTTAGTIAACGLIEIANAVPEFEKDLYLNAAVRILKNTEAKYCDWSETEDSIVQMGTEAYQYGHKNLPIVYGDYYFIEAIQKLRGSKLQLSAATESN